MITVLLLIALAQDAGVPIVCYATTFGPYQDSCTGELLPLPMLRSPRIEWLEPESYTDRVLQELSLRILMLESKIALLTSFAQGDIRTLVQKKEQPQ